MFIYTYACHEDELDLCLLEQRAMFGMEASAGGVLVSTAAVDPSRSPFIRERLDVFLEAGSLAELAGRVDGLQVESTFKVISVKLANPVSGEQLEYSGHRSAEKEIGLRIRGKADMRRPDRLFGVLLHDGRWYFGSLLVSQAVWLRHTEKPRNFTMALPTRTARALVNIAVPDPTGVKAIDPCCGIGTVLVEALSMGIDIVGRDINPLVVRGARENIAHFGLNGDVILGDIAAVTAYYDAAVIDMPYNLVSKSSAEEQLDILRHARRIAGRVVVISIDDMKAMAAAVGFRVMDGGTVRKGSFERRILVLHSAPHIGI